MTNNISKQYLNNNNTEERKVINWKIICQDIRKKLGKDIYESCI
jgi:hypothetical protein